MVHSKELKEISAETKSASREDSHKNSPGYLHMLKRAGKKVRNDIKTKEQRIKRLIPKESSSLMDKFSKEMAEFWDDVENKRLKFSDLENELAAKIIELYPENGL